MNPYPTPKKIKDIQWAYAEMKKRGWGFTSNGCGFGDPRATITVVGPYDGVLVEAWGADRDPVEAVRKAIAKSETLCAGCGKPISWDAPYTVEDGQRLHSTRMCFDKWRTAKADEKSH